MRVNRVHVVAAVGAVGALLLAGCSGGGSSSDDTAGSGTDGASGDGDVVELTFWSWPEGTDEIVDAFNASHPDIQVRYTNAGGGDDSSAKILTAVRSGNAPDVSAVEYTTLPSMIVSGAVMDITDYVGDIQDAFSEGAWEQTTFDGVVYGVPQDVGPAAMVYNAAVFEADGIEVPTTWEEYRAAAAQVREADPSAYIGAFPSSELGFWASVAAQAGSQWWDYDGDSWAVNIGDEATQEVADFFQQMYEDDLISVQSLLTTEYNAQLNADQMLTWTSALWATGVVQGVASEEQMGGWRMGRFPQWGDSGTAVPYQGGSALFVTSTCEHPEEAMEFIRWYNASEEGTELLLTANGSYPAATVGQELTATLPEPELVEGQTDYYELAADIASDTISVSWGPNVSYAKTVLTEKLSAAMENGTSWADAFVATGEAVAQDLTDQGYTVAD